MPTAKQAVAEGISLRDHFAARLAPVIYTIKVADHAKLVEKIIESASTEEQVEIMKQVAAQSGAFVDQLKENEKLLIEAIVDNTYDLADKLVERSKR